MDFDFDFDYWADMVDNFNWGEDICIECENPKDNGEEEYIPF